MRPLMLDLFSGSGAASEPARRAGWEVVRVDVDPSTPADIHADLATWRWKGRRPAFIWASPPCPEFSRHDLPWTRAANPPPPDLTLLRATREIIKRSQATYWLIENVRGAIPFFRPLLGAHRLAAPPFYLWGNFPPPPPQDHRGYKQYNAKRTPAARATIPAPLAAAVFNAVADALTLLHLGDTGPRPETNHLVETVRLPLTQLYVSIMFDDAGTPLYTTHPYPRQMDALAELQAAHPENDPLAHVAAPPPCQAPTP